VTVPTGLLRRGFELAESALDTIFGAAANPVHLLGALAWFCFWIVIATGIYLYIFFDSGVTQAWESVEYLTHTQWYAGGMMRSLHRYASDAMVVVVLLHMLREFAYGRMGGARWFTWMSGVPLLWFLFAAGISGYWVVWDRLAQYVAVATTEWLDALPLFAEPIARNFLHADALSGRFFTLLVFIHIAVPLFMLFVMWIHIQRLAHPRVNPPRSLALGVLGTLALLSVLKPAVSHAPANLDTLPATLNLDWFFLFIYPLLEAIRAETTWAVVFGATLLLLLLPFLARARNTGLAVVSLENCNGCGRCYEDCPFGAITMEPRSDGRHYSREAVVSADRCVGCGICAGACPTGMPFRRRTALVPGIDLDILPLSRLRDLLAEASSALAGTARVILVGCAHGPKLDGLADRQVATVQLPCLAMLPPAFIDFILARGLGEGVLLAGCRENNCYHRLGDVWTRGRLDRTRDPFLRARVPAHRVHVEWAGAGGRARLERALARFRRELEQVGPGAAADNPGESGHA
jgi:ferredoxin/coenzyme F420-reducing hydrogenase delta subunit